MCSICGILGEGGRHEALEDISGVMRRRGPDQSGIFFGKGISLGHNRLAVLDIQRGIQPMTRLYRGRSYTIVYNGEIYNTAELRERLREAGIEPETHCDTEVVLYTYILFGARCASLLNGIFAFAVYDEAEGSVYFARDRFGVKPLFYTQVGETLVFASEIKSLLRYPGVRPVVDSEGLWELLFLSPVRMGCIFRDIAELPPAHQAIWREGKLCVSPYWALEAKENREGRGEIVEHTRALLVDAIERQLDSDVPLCALLSGGLDSTVVSAVTAAYYRRRGARLSTCSFEYEGNRESFHSSLFQPQSDDEYALYAAQALGTEHEVFTAPTQTVADLLGPAALARDFPGQADIDSSLLYFCRRIKEKHTVAMSGECADEIFGGYPWFYRPEMLEKPFFPWIHEPMLRPSLFRAELARPEEGYAFLQARYRESMARCPVLERESETMRVGRRASWLSVNYFMSSLLERKDRMSMASAVEVRVPFADHRILEYVYNVPWEVKFENGVEKALLRNAMADLLPARVLHRKKSPYPKTQNPLYEQAVRTLLRQRLEKKNSPLAQMLNREALDEFCRSGGGTWFGQLMDRPQLLAWLVQFDVWAEAYQVQFVR